MGRRRHFGKLLSYTNSKPQHKTGPALSHVVGSLGWDQRSLKMVLAQEEGGTALTNSAPTAVVSQPQQRAHTTHKGTTLAALDSGHQG